MKESAGGLATVGGLVLLWQRISGKMGKGLATDLQQLSERVEKLEKLADRSRVKLILLEENVKRMGKADVSMMREIRETHDQVHKLSASVSLQQLYIEEIKRNIAAR